MRPRSQPSEKGADELEVAVDEAIAACGGDMRSTIRALIVANEYLESAPVFREDHAQTKR